MTNNENKDIKPSSSKPSVNKIAAKSKTSIDNKTKSKLQAQSEILTEKEARINQKLEKEQLILEEQAKFYLNEEKEKFSKKDLASESTKDNNNSSTDVLNQGNKSTGEVETLTPTSQPSIQENSTYMSNNTSSQHTISQINEEKIAQLKSRVNFLTFALIVVIGAAGFGAYYFDKHKYDDMQEIAASIKSTQEQILSVQKSVNTVYDRIQAKDSRIDDLFTSNADLKAQNNAIKANSENLAESVKNVLAQGEKINIRLNNYESRNPNDWLIAQSYFLVANGQNILSVTDNIQSVIFNLEQADSLLVKIDDHKITSIREAIIDDIVTLKNVPHIDYQGISFKLDSIYNNIDSMPLNEFLDTKSHDKQFAQKPTPGSSVKNWKENLLESAKKFSSRFIEIRRRNDSVVNEFLSPDQTNILIKNLKTEILLAKVDLANRNQDAFEKNIEQTIGHIIQYFDLDSEVVKANLEILNDLKDTNIYLEKPQLKSFNIFNKYAIDHFQLYNSKSAKKEGQQ